MVQGNQLKPEYLTQSRLDEIRLELVRLKTKRRTEVAERLEYAKSLGDLSENAEYHEAREEQAWLEDKIMRLEDIIRRSIVIKKKEDGEVALGSTVTLIKNGSEEEIIYNIVGSAESNLAQKKLSFESPIGKAIMQKRAGDTVKVNTPRGVSIYKIIAVA